MDTDLVCSGEIQYIRNIVDLSLTELEGVASPA